METPRGNPPGGRGRGRVRADDVATGTYNPKPRTHVVQARVDETLMQALRAEAREADMSLSAVVRLCLAHVATVKAERVHRELLAQLGGDLDREREVTT